MTRKGQEIRDKILFYLDRNPDGLRIGVIQKLIDVSRNSIYRYLEELESQGLIEKQDDKNWKLKEPIKPKTIPGYQYQAFLLGLEKIGGLPWSIESAEGRKNFKDLGRFMFAYLKVPTLDVDTLKQKSHHMKEIMDYAIQVIQEAAVANLSVSEPMIQCIEKIIETRDKKGRIILAGMGKAGLISAKMSATLASIGFPSFFVSPAESVHGDIGRIAPEDMLLVFSHSGKTAEVIKMVEQVHILNRNQNYVITVGSSETPKIPHNLAIYYGKIHESCIVEKVPSTSTTLMLIIADVLAITAAEAKGFHDSDFKVRHPGGAIGESYSAR